MSRAVHCLIVLIALLGSAGSPSADPDTARRTFAALDETLRVEVQLLLVATGHYSGMADGAFGGLTYTAIRDFQAANGFRPTGILGERELDALRRAGHRFLGALGLKAIAFDALGIKISVPLAATPRSYPVNRGIRYASDDGALMIDLLSVPETDHDFEEVFRRTLAPHGNKTITYQRRSGDAFVAGGTLHAHRFYSRFTRNGPRSVGFIVVWNDRVVKSGQRIAVLLSNTFVPLGTEIAAPVPGQDGPPQTGQGPEAAKAPSSGSGFFVSAAGHVLTNHHVVSGCANVLVVGHGLAQVASTDTSNDLALLRLANANVAATLSFRASPVRLGEDVVALGYPLRGIIGDGLNVTTGIVSALSGLESNSSQVQFTAPIQPGNSGGALIDRRGAVIGIVVAKLNDIATLKSAGFVAQGVNFAVRSEVATLFLQRNALSPRFAGEAQDRSTADLAEQARSAVVAIECLR